MIPKNDFSQAVYKIVCKIPKGRVITYGQVATHLGYPRAAQYVGWCLHWANHKTVPYQRVVNRFGGLATGYPEGGRKGHERDLLEEGIRLTNDGFVDLEKYQWVL